jgi:hypothetical protein
MTSLPVLPAAEPEAGADWLQFLGRHRNNRSPETGLNLDWAAKPPRVVWKKPIGAGFSSVARVGDRLFKMVNRGERD